MRLTIFIAGIIAAIATAVWIASHPPVGYRLLSSSLSYGQALVWTDPETGCEYIVRGSARTTVRLGSDGQPMCGAAR